MARTRNYLAIARERLAALLQAGSGAGYGRVLLPNLLILILLLLIWASFTIGRAMSIERQAREQSVYTSGVVKRLNAVLLEAVDVETAQRGYLLTGERTYLEPFRAALRSNGRAIDDLKMYALPNATPAQERWIVAIDRLTNAHFADARATIDMAREGRSVEAVASIRSGNAKRRMDAIRLLIQRYNDFESAQLAEQITAAGRYETVGSRQLWAIGVLLLILIGLISYLVARNLRLLKTESELIEVSAAKEQIELISRELNHRVKNLFAIVMAIITMTARRETDAAVAARKTRERVAALAAAHDLTLVEGSGGGVVIGALVDTVLAPYASDSYRFSVRGPPVRLPTRMATPVGLALHELATNAVKYGAWSTESGGSIAVTWRIAPSDPDARVVTLEWQESGGPPTTAPAASGFGSVMIQQGMRQIGGAFSTDWRPEGLHAALEFSLSKELDGGA